MTNERKPKKPPELQYTFDFEENGRFYRAAFHVWVKENDVDRVVLKLKKCPRSASCSYEHLGTTVVARVIPSSPETIVNMFISSVKRGAKGIFLTGAGVSQAAGIPTLSDILSDIGRDFVKKAMDPKQRKEIERKWKSFMQCTLRAMKSQVPETHKIIAKFVERLGATLMTTNYDGLHEKAGPVIRSDKASENEIRSLIVQRKPIVVLLLGTSGHLNEDNDHPSLTYLIDEAKKKRVKISLLHAGLGSPIVYGIDNIYHCMVSAVDFCRFLRDT